MLLTGTKSDRSKGRFGLQEFCLQLSRSQENFTAYVVRQASILQQSFLRTLLHSHSRLKVPGNPQTAFGFHSPQISYSTVLHCKLLLRKITHTQKLETFCSKTRKPINGRCQIKSTNGHLGQNLSLTIILYACWKGADPIFSAVEKNSTGQIIRQMNAMSIWNCYVSKPGCLLHEIV